MSLDTAILIFLIASLALVVTVLMVYGSFGPGSESLIDPFEEDAD